MSVSQFDVRSEIMQMIAKTQDADMRAVLLLLAGVLDDLNKKFDTLLNDEQAIRQIVLNGHESVHKEHHDWIAERIQSEKDSAKEEDKLKLQLRYRIYERAGWILLAAALGAHWLVG